MFLMFWICCNSLVLYIIIVDEYEEKNDMNSYGVTEYIMFYLAGSVIFRVLISALDIIKWKWRYKFNSNYKISHHDLKKKFDEFKNMQDNKKDQLDV